MSGFDDDTVMCCGLTISRTTHKEPAAANESHALHHDQSYYAQKRSSTVAGFIAADPVTPRRQHCSGQLALVDILKRPDAYIEPRRVQIDLHREEGPHVGFCSVDITVSERTARQLDAIGISITEASDLYQLEGEDVVIEIVISLVDVALDDQCFCFAARSGSLRDIKVTFPIAPLVEGRAESSVPTFSAEALAPYTYDKQQHMAHATFHKKGLLVEADLTCADVDSAWAKFLQSLPIACEVTYDG